MIFLIPPRDLPCAASPCQETHSHAKDQILLLAKAQIKHANTGDLFAVPVTVAAHVQGGHAVAAYTAIRHKSPADVKPTRTVLLAHPPAPMKTTAVAPPAPAPKSYAWESASQSHMIHRMTDDELVAAMTEAASVPRSLAYLDAMRISTKGRRDSLPPEKNAIILAAMARAEKQAGRA